MSLRFPAGLALGAAAIIAVGSCSTGGDVPEGPREVVQPLPEAAVPTPTATISVPPPPPVTARTSFSYRGELEQGGWIRGRVPSNTRAARLGDQPLGFTDEGAFFAAFDRDQGPSIELTATLDDGRTISSPLTIAPRDWDLEYVNVPYRASSPSRSRWNSALLRPAR